MKENEEIFQDSLELNADQLRGKQSVRATFRLSGQMIGLLRIAALHLGVKQKSLIDELVKDRETLERVAMESDDISQQNTKRRQKTFVLSRYALDLLDDISSKYNLSRDYLVELCIGRLVSFVDSEQEKHKQRRTLIKDVEQYLLDGKKLLEKADAILSNEDRFLLKLQNIVHDTEQNVAELKKFVKEKKTLIY